MQYGKGRVPSVRRSPKWLEVYSLSIGYGKVPVPFGLSSPFVGLHAVGQLDGFHLNNGGAMSSILVPYRRHMASTAGQK